MKFDLHPVPRARNLARIGWTAGYMLVEFKGRPQQYIFGPKIPQEEEAKLFRSLYPDALFQKIIKKKFKCHKLGSK